jgi:D-glycerate 3-kinase
LAFRVLREPGSNGPHSDSLTIVCIATDSYLFHRTTVTDALRSSLSSPPHNLRVVVLSIDDLLLPYEGLRNVADTHKGNGLLIGRGHAGTHDLELGARLLQQLHDINLPSSEATTESNIQDVKIPKFDKSAHEGYGGRAPETEWSRILGPVDVVILEGWCLGFYPLEEDELASRWDTRWELGVPRTIQMEGGVKDIKVVNEYLKEYVDRWYGFFKCFVQVSSSLNLRAVRGLTDERQIAVPPTHPLEFIWNWRMQQEHSMKAKNGGRGMTDEQVIAWARFHLTLLRWYGMLTNCAALWIGLSQAMCSLVMEFRKGTSPERLVKPYFHLGVEGALGSRSTKTVK